VGGCGRPEIITGESGTLWEVIKVNFSALNSDDETSCRTASYHSEVSTAMEHG